MHTHAQNELLCVKRCNENSQIAVINYATVETRICTDARKNNELANALDSFHSGDHYATRNDMCQSISP